MGTLNVFRACLPSPGEAFGSFYKMGVMVSILAATSPATIAAPNQIQHEMVLARNYGLAACIIARYPGTPLAHEVDEWAIGLVEDGNLPGEAYPAFTFRLESIMTLFLRCYCRCC